MTLHSPSSRLSTAAVFLAAIVFLSLAAIWNGQPIFYSDTPTYVRGAEMGVTRAVGPNRIAPWRPSAPEPSANTGTSTASGQPQSTDAAARQTQPLTSIDDKIVLAGRSVYYGALLYAGYLGGNMWLTVLLQALAVTYMLHLLMVRLWGFRTRNFVLTTGLLAVFTPLALYTGFLMPDIFAPLVILGVGALIVYWPRLRRGDRWLVGALVLFGLAAHASHVVLAVGMLALALLARMISTRWRRLSGAGLVLVFACIGGALLAEWVFGKAVTIAIGAPPLRLPHPMARLIDLGPGTDLLRKTCPQSGYAACNFVQNYPTAWDDFLFSTDPGKGAFALADAATKRRLSDEQMRFALDVVRHDPTRVVTGVAASIVDQLINFRVDLWYYGEGAVEKLYVGRVPDQIYADMLQSRAASPSVLNGWQTMSTYAAVAAALITLAALWLTRRSPSTTPANSTTTAMTDFCVVVLTGVIVNAVVCATFASSLDRFQARVIWLLPFIAWAMYCVSRGPGRLSGAEVTSDGRAETAAVIR